MGSHKVVWRSNVEPMRRHILLFVALVLVVAACGGASEDASSSATTASPSEAEGTTETPVATTSVSSEAPDTTVAGQSEDPAATTEAVAPEPEGEPAPDFTLALADGGEFMLSADTRPVYMVFWAEW